MCSSFKFYIFVLNSAVALTLVGGQQYDFAAEFTRQCLVPDPVGLLDCVVKKVTLPYLSSWTACVKSLGENVNTLPEIINHRCKTIWEGKGIMPEIFFIRDCVIEKIGLPAKNVSTEILGAYNECEKPTTKDNSQSRKGNPVAGGNRISQESVADVKLSGMAIQHMQPIGRPPSTRQYFALYPMQPISPTQSNAATISTQQQLQYVQQQQVISRQSSAQQQPISQQFVPQQQQNYFQQQQGFSQQRTPQQQQYVLQENVPQSQQKYVQPQFIQQQNPPLPYAPQQLPQQQQQRIYTQLQQPLRQVNAQPPTVSQVQYVQQQSGYQQQQYSGPQNVPLKPQNLLGYTPQPQYVQQSQMPNQQPSVKTFVEQEKVIQQVGKELKQQPAVKNQQKITQKMDFQEQKFVQAYNQQYSKSQTFSQPIDQRSSSVSVVPRPVGGVYSYSFATNHPVRKV